MSSVIKIRESRQSKCRSCGFWGLRLWARRFCESKEAQHSLSSCSAKTTSFKDSSGKSLDSGLPSLIRWVIPGNECKVSS